MQGGRARFGRGEQKCLYRVTEAWQQIKEDKHPLYWKAKGCVQKVSATLECRRSNIELQLGLPLAWLQPQAHWKVSSSKEPAPQCLLPAPPLCSRKEKISEHTPTPGQPQPENEGLTLPKKPLLEAWTQL